MPGRVGRLEKSVPPERPALRDLLVRKGRKGTPVGLAHKGPQVFKGRRVRKVRLVHPARRGRQERPGPQERKATRGTLAQLDLKDRAAIQAQ